MSDCLSARPIASPLRTPSLYERHCTSFRQLLRPNRYPETATAARATSKNITASARQGRSPSESAFARAMTTTPQKNASPYSYLI